MAMTMDYYRKKVKFEEFSKRSEVIACMPEVESVTHSDQDIKIVFRARFDINYQLCEHIAKVHEAYSNVIVPVMVAGKPRVELILLYK